MLSKVTTSKISSCFICSQEFPLADLTAHEKECLDYLKTNENDLSYTREKSTDTLSNSSFQSAYNSNLSAHSSSSGEVSEKKYSRCYICGSDVPNYLSSIHEKNCKKSWETGLLNSICTPARKSKSKGDLSSIPRSSSRDDLLKGDSFLSKPTFTKSKSTTNIRQEIKNETSARDTSRPRHLKSTNPRNAPIKSKSISNLSNIGPSHSLNRSSKNIKNSSSNQDIRKVSESNSTKRSDPQYVVCQICGKLYSIHSISIHQRTCERTYKKQKDVGTNVEYKIKSKSLADLTKPSTPSRPQSATPKANHTPSKMTTRPLTANPTTRLSKNSTLSKSTGNLGPSSYKRQLMSVKKDIVDGEAVITNGESTEADVGKSSPRLRKCYLCGQLYGTRSIPIHEKQCLKKWEREQEEEKKKKKKKKNGPKKDIKIMAFGKSKFNDDNEEVDSKNKNGDIDQQAETPSKLFGVPSPLKVNNNELDEPTVNGTMENIEKRVEEAKTPAKNGPKFVVCVYCSRQFRFHSISIHEKNCREKQNIEKQTKERIMDSEKKPKQTREKNLSKSVGDISLREALGHQENDDMLQLIKCKECSRKFLKSDIERHRIHCRVSIL